MGHSLKKIGLTDAFYCHARTPEFGFWGELREMVRQDMTIGDAIPFHNTNFNFEHVLPGISHEISHQILATAAIYNPRFAFLLPRIDNKTGFPEASGYNGFEDGEVFTWMIEHGLINRIAGDDLDFGYMGRDAFIHHTRHYQENQSPHSISTGFAWGLADRHPEPISVFEVKRRHRFYDKAIKDFFESGAMRSNGGFDFRSPQKGQPPVLNEYGEVQFSAFLGMKNRHGEELKPVHHTTHDDVGALYDTVEPFIKHLAETFAVNEAPRLRRAWKPIKVRDMHRLIGGEEAAEAYFRKCGAPAVSTRKLTPA